MNYFSPKSAAERYAIGRPNFHHITIKRIKDYLGIDHKINKALDVACGTGLSSQALLEIANEVNGIDLSPEMLNLASQKNKIKYSIGPAEQLPHADCIFDLVTVSSGVHWFDIDLFLTEANRVLRPDAWLVIYENYFLAEMPDKVDFEFWYQNTFQKKFPAPPRNNNYNWTNENLKTKQFIINNEMPFKNAVTFNKQQLILYFTTQSNIIASVEKKDITYEDAETWLSHELNVFFENEQTKRSINFGNWIKFIQKKV